MASIAANATDYVSSKVFSFGTIVFTMSDLAAVLASLIFIVTKGTVQSSKLTKLVALQFVLTFRNGCSLESVS